jgi:hypothetical protein
LYKKSTPEKIENFRSTAARVTLLHSLAYCPQQLGVLPIRTNIETREKISLLEMESQFSAGRYCSDDSVMANEGHYAKEADLQAGQDPTVQKFRPIFSAIPFSKVSSRDVSNCEVNEADMDDERPQSARTVDGYSRVRDLMDIDSAFANIDHSATKPRPLYGVHEDCFAHVLRFLPIRVLSLTSRVSRDLHKACNCDSLWIKLCHSEYGSEVSFSMHDFTDGSADLLTSMGVQNAPSLMERYSKLIKPGTSNFWKTTFQAIMSYQIQLVFSSGPRAGETQVVIWIFASPFGGS